MHHQPDRKRKDTLDYLQSMLGQLQSNGRGGGLRHARLSDRDGLYRGERPDARRASRPQAGRRRLGLPGRSDTEPPACRSRRPARSSSSRIMNICAGCSPVWRISSSMPTGVGPSASTTRMRSESSGGAGVPRSPAVRRTAGGRGMALPASGASAAMMSAASVTRMAPSFSRPLVPAARGSSGEPGTAKTSRPISPASRALISEPERFAASTTTRPERQAGDDAVAARKILGARLPAERHFRDDGAAASAISSQQVDVFGRVGLVEPAGQHRDRAGREAALMRGRVDAARQPGDDGVALLAEVRRPACAPS